jgi:gp16 family phage-associated protein
MPTPHFTEQALQRARSRLNRQGLSVRDWAAQHRLNDRTVYEVLAGRRPCLRGESHRAAVLLGLKRGVIAVPSSSTKPKTH